MKESYIKIDILILIVLFIIVILASLFCDISLKSITKFGEAVIICLMSLYVALFTTMIESMFYKTSKTTNIDKVLSRLSFCSLLYRILYNNVTILAIVSSLLILLDFIYMDYSCELSLLYYKNKNIFNPRLLNKLIIINRNDELIYIKAQDFYWSEIGGFYYKKDKKPCFLSQEELMSIQFPQRISLKDLLKMYKES